MQRIYAAKEARRARQQSIDIETVQIQSRDKTKYSKRVSAVCRGS